MLYLYRFALLILAFLFHSPFSNLIWVWAILSLIPGTVLGSYVGAALQKEAIDEMEAEAREEEFEYSDLINPRFKRMVTEMFLAFSLLGTLGFFLSSSRVDSYENLLVLTFLSCGLSVALLGSGYTALLLANGDVQDAKRKGGIGGFAYVAVFELAFLAIDIYDADGFFLLALFSVPLSLILLRHLAKRPHPERVGPSSWLTAAISGTLLLPFVMSFFLMLVTPMGNRSGGSLTACKSNLKNIGTAMEMYSTDWSGKYPEDLGMLTPNYLKTIPECPSAGEITYTLQTGKNTVYNTDGYEDYYFLQCEGENHTRVSVPPNYPQYDGLTGLIER